MTQVFMSDNIKESVDLADLENMIAVCWKEMDLLDDNETNFIEQMEKRVSQFGVDVYITSKQLNWLTKIHKKVS